MCCPFGKCLSRIFLSPKGSLKASYKPTVSYLCGSKTPVTTFLFGDNILETAKTIQSSQKMTRHFATNRHNFSSNRSTYRAFNANGNRPAPSLTSDLNFRGATNQSWRFRQHQRMSTTNSSFTRKSQAK